MKDLTTPLNKNKSLNRRNEFSKNIRKIILNEESKSSKGKYLNDGLLIKDLKINLDNITKNKNIDNDEIKSNRIYKKIALPSLNNQFINKNFDSLKTKNFLSEENDLIYERNIGKNKRRKNLTNEKLNYQIKKQKKFSNMKEVNEIVNSLINPKINIYNDTKDTKITEEKIKYPREKMIDPLYYIKYNINKKPLKKGLEKSFKQHIQEIEDNKNEPFLLKEQTGVNYGRIRIDNINNSDKEKIYNEMWKKMERKKEFIFDLKDENYYKKIKNNNIMEQKIIENKNKSKLLLKFKKLLIDINKNKGVRFVESFVDNKINKFKSFDERMDVILNNTKATENNINQKSRFHEKLINKINNIYKYY